MKETNEIVTPEKLSALVARARRGEQDAYTALYEATSQEVYRTVRAMVRSEDQALDIQQDVYVQAFTHLDQLEEPSKFRVWLRSITVNCARSELRKQTPLLFSEIDTQDGAVVPELPDQRPGNTPELALEQKETAGYIREILDGLTPGQRMLVGMYYYEQIPASEIARELEVSPGTVKTQLFRSRKKIEAAVKRLEDRGVKLFGLAPLPFLLTLLKRQEPAAAASREVLQASLAESGVASKTVAVHLGRRFFQTALGRVLLGLLTAAALGGGVAAWNWYQSRPMGDYQPPTSLEETLTDSMEDLTEPSTAPTDTAAPSDTEEDLTEPATEQPETTEIPEATAPANPAANNQPANSTNSFPSLSGSDASDNIRPRLVSCNWGESDELYDQAWGSWRYIWIVTENGGVPSVYTDNESVVQLSDTGGFTGYGVSEGQTGYAWIATFIGSGTAHVYVELEGEIVHVLTVDNPDYPEMILQCSIPFYDEVESFELKRDEILERITILVQGMTKPTFYVDHPEIVKADYLSGFTGSKTNWIHKGYHLDVYPLKPGTAHITISLNGTVYRTITVTVLDEYLFPKTSTEPTEPTESTYPSTEPAESTESTNPPTEPPTESPVESPTP